MAVGRLIQRLLNIICHVFSINFPVMKTCYEFVANSVIDCVSLAVDTPTRIWIPWGVCFANCGNFS